MIEKKDTKNLNAFRSLYQNFFPILCLFANKYIQNEQVSKDIVQDAFLYCWTKKIDMSSILGAKTYLFKHVRNRSLNYLRDQRFVNDGDFDSKGDLIFFRDQVIEQETYQLIYKAIKALSPQGQSVIELTLDGLKNHEIAERMGVTVNTVKTTKRRAFQTLRIELKENIFALLWIFQRVSLQPITADCDTYFKDLP